MQLGEYVNSLKNIQRKNTVKVIEKNNKCESTNKQEMRSYCIEKFLKTIERREQCVAKRNWDCFSDEDCTDPSVLRTNESQNNKKSLKKPKRSENTITNYFKDVKLATSSRLNNYNKENKVGDSDACSDRRIIQPHQNKTTPIEEFLGKVSGKINNKSSLPTTLEDTQKSSCDVMSTDCRVQKTISDVMKEIRLLSNLTGCRTEHSFKSESAKAQNPITKFIESLDTRKRGKVDSLNTSENPLSSFVQFTKLNVDANNTENKIDVSLISKNEDDSIDFADYLTQISTDKKKVEYLKPDSPIRQYNHDNSSFSKDTKTTLSHENDGIFHCGPAKLNIMKYCSDIKVPEKSEKNTIRHKDTSNKPNLFEDDDVKNILTENYEKYHILSGKLEAKCKSQIDNFCKKFNSSRKSNEKSSFKRFRKGKVKIYRLSKLKKPVVAPTEEPENLSINELLFKMSQSFAKPTSKFARSSSASSVSTSSSYLTDKTLSGTLSTGSNELSSPQQKLRKGLNEICKDKSLFCDKQGQFFPKFDADEVKMRIQSIFLQVFDDLTRGRRSFLKYRRQNFENCVLKDGRLQLKSDDASFTVVDSTAQRSQAKFKLILYILKKIQTLLETNTKLTKRELFYQLKHLIGNQRVTDRAINSISCLLDVGMWGLNIVAQKGLVFGNLRILLASGETINCNVPGTLIPLDIGDIVQLESCAYFILVVEKESIFHKLIEEDLPNRLTRPFVMITGKGFPDLNTQLFLKLLWTAMAVPVFLLVDADPHGISIMLNYRFGSVNNAHVSQHLAVPHAKWLGVFPSEIENVNVKRQAMTARETQMARQLLSTPYMAENPRIAEELTVLIEKNYKAGIEGLIKSEVYLSEVYLPTKFFTKDFV